MSEGNLEKEVTKMKVFIYAYDQLNLGDDLFIAFLVQRYPHVQFEMLVSPNYKAAFAAHPNLHITDPNGGFSRLLQRIRPSFRSRYHEMIKSRCDCCVYIGGSIFIEYPTWRNIVNWWQYHTAKYPFFVLGANFGPYHEEAYRNTMKQVYDQTQDVCFRDRYSYELFRDCPNVRVAPDILFAQAFPKTEPKKQVLVSVIDCRENHTALSFAADAYEDFLCEILERYAGEGYRILLASFCKAEGDEIACERIRERLENAKIPSDAVYYDGKNRTQLLEEIAASEMIIGTRFHATVLGMAAAEASDAPKMLLPVIYSEKTKNMLCDIGYAGNTVDLRMDLSKQPKEASAVDKNSIKMAAAGAEAHFLKLDQKLRGI